MRRSRSGAGVGGWRRCEPSVDAHWEVERSSWLSTGGAELGLSVGQVSTTYFQAWVSGGGFIEGHLGENARKYR